MVLQFKSRFGWRPPRPFSTRRRLLSRMRKKLKSQPHPRFSHSPPGHTCGLPCCSEDSHIHARGLNAPTSRYSCMPVPNHQADLENNFTFRRSKLLHGRPTFTNKFYSLQTKSFTARAGLPRFHDDFGIAGEAKDGGGQEEAGAADADTAHETLRRYRATIETDTDGSPLPYMDRTALDSRSVIRTPIRYLQPWECFHNREIILPDLPSTPRKMVFLDYRPEESQDGADGGEQEETIEVYTSGYNPPSSSTPKRAASSSRPRVSRSSSSVSSPSSLTSPATTHSSTSSSTHTTSTSKAASSASSRPKTTYSGTVRSIPAPVIQMPLKSALKKPKSDAQTGDDGKENKCPACQGQSQADGQGQSAQDEPKPDQFRNSSSPVCPVPGTSASGMGASLPGRLEEDLLQQTDSENLYESHVYDVPSELSPGLLDEQERTRRSSSKHRYDKLNQKPPPVPPTRRNDKPKPDHGRRAITPEMKRRFTSDPKSSSGDKVEERYSTFPTRKRHHHYEEVILRHLEKVPFHRDADADLEISHMDIFAASEKTQLLDQEETEGEESLYEALNPAFLSDTWNLDRDHSGGSLGSVQSAHLSHGSYASYGCTCLSGDLQRLTLDDVGKESDVTAGEGKGGEVEGKRSGFLADNPITLIL